MKTLLLATLVVGLTACASSGTQPGDELAGARAVVVDLDDQDSQLVTSFNENHDRAQLVVVLSPT